MKSVFTIEFDSSFILDHRDDEVLPVAAAITFLNGYFEKGVKVFDSSFTALSFETESDKIEADAVQKDFLAFLSERYGAGSDVIVSFSAKEAEKEQSEPKKETKKEEKNADAISAPIRDLINGGFSIDGSEKKAESNEDKLKTVMQKVADCFGGEEFKALADEIVKVAPEILENGTQETFVSQCYLFSINDGYGLTHYLKLFAELISATGLLPVNSVNPTAEIKLSKPARDDAPFSEDLLSTVKYGSKDRVQILSIDISEWMNSLGDPRFKEVLMELENHAEEFIYVFRIPFVDKEVLYRTSASLNDLVFIRDVSFSPLTNGEIESAAQKKIEKYGFKMTKEAWTYFHQRITEEKSDGKFYGLNTVKKVVRELIYKKQLLNAKSKKPNKTIGGKDASSICLSAPDTLSGYEMLKRMVGGEKIKAQIDEIVSQIELARQNKSLGTPCIHMRFVGNPGTGKTTVARIVGKILKERGVLRIGNFYEYSGRDFCGRYIGETAPKTASMCRDAYGSVLFIDEAYSLYRGDADSRDYGREALDTLIAEMENHRSDLVVIMAGYTDDMEKLMSGNAGLASRMPYIINFPNFTREELYKIFVTMMEGKFEYDEDILPAAKEYFDNLPEDLIGSKEFSNGRFVRNLFERTWGKAAMRSQLNKTSKVILKKEDFVAASSDGDFKVNLNKKPRMGFNR